MVRQQAAAAAGVEGRSTAVVGQEVDLLRGERVVAVQVPPADGVGWVRGEGEEDGWGCGWERMMRGCRGGGGA